MSLFNGIVVPVDGSEFSAHALSAAAVMAKVSRAPMTLLRSFDGIPEWQADSGHGRFRGSMALAEHDRIGAMLRAKQSQLADQEGVDVEIGVAAFEGAPHDAIIDFANRDPSALIIMSTHGRGGLSRMLAGSVTAKVVRAVNNPAMIVRCNERDCPVVPRYFENIIVPLDGSRFSENSLDYAAGLAAAFGARITLVRTTPSSDQFRARADWEGGPMGAGFGPYDTPHLSAILSETARDYLWHKADDLSARFPVFDVEVMHSLKSPSEAVIELAEGLDNPLVVMATRGRRGVGRALLGSVADRIVRHSPAPTLLVRQPLRSDWSILAAGDNEQHRRDDDRELTAA